MRFLPVLLFVALLLVGSNGVSGATEKQVVAGAGPSTVIVQMFFGQFDKQTIAKDYDFFVPERSAKHAGGIQCSDKYLFGRTGRPLNSAEKGLNKEELFLAKVPIAFAVGADVGISALSLEQLKAIYLGQIGNWQELGGRNAEIFLVGREPTEALFSILKNAYPFFEKAKFFKVLKKDHQVVNFLKSPQGKHAIGFGAKPNFSSLKTLDIDQFSTGVNVGLVYDRAVKDRPVVVAAKEFARSSEWQSRVSLVGLLPAD
jgi:ABC-type phosphate transport system substrate-binding protein